MGGGHTLCLGCPWQGHCPYGNLTPNRRWWNFYISDPELSVCLCIRSTCEWDGFAAATQTESDSSRAELRESRDSAHDCQSRELRSRTTHAGVITICTVPEMLPETWTRGDDVKRGGSVLRCHFSQRLSIRTRTPPCPSPSPSSPPCASPPSRSRAATLPPG